MKALTIDIAVATIGEKGLGKFERMLTPPEPGVRWVVSWQEHAGKNIPQFLRDRNDVEILRFEGKGLSRNRNNAIENCVSDIVLIADDDLDYEEDFVFKIRECFNKKKEIDLALFKVKFQKEKRYPSSTGFIQNSLPKGYYVSSVEMAFRRDKIKDLSFYPELGLGATEMRAGEDEMFFFSAMKRGLNCWFENSFIASHPSPTTSEKLNSDVLKGMGFVISLMYPVSYRWRILLKAIRNRIREKMGFAEGYKALKYGARRCKKEFREIPFKYRW